MPASDDPGPLYLVAVEDDAHEMLTLHLAGDARPIHRFPDWAVFEAALPLDPGVAIVRLPEDVAAVETLAALDAPLAFIVLTDEVSLPMAVDAMRRGVAALIQTPTDIHGLLDAIEIGMRSIARMRSRGD